MKKEVKKHKQTKRAKQQTKRCIMPIILFASGIISFCISLVFLVITLSTPKTADAEYLVQIGAWTEETANSVVWNFTEIGKGTLTTNDHLNDYDFTWSLEGNSLKIETNWLYTLENEYAYTLNREEKTLTLTFGDKTVKFIPAETTQANL